MSVKSSVDVSILEAISVTRTCSLKFSITSVFIWLLLLISKPQIYFLLWLIDSDDDSLKLQVNIGKEIYHVYAGSDLRVPKIVSETSGKNPKTTDIIKSSQ